MLAKNDLYARDNLNVLPLSFLSAKDSEVLARLSSLMRRWPDPNLYPALLLSLLKLPISFKKLRSVMHLTRLIGAEYFYKRKAADGSPQRRRLYVKLLRTSLEYPFGSRSVLGIVVAFNLMKQKEAFEEQHVIEAVRRIIPDVRGVEGSFIDSQDREMGVHSVYLEIEKTPHATPFTGEDIAKLQSVLPAELKGCIEQLVPMTFMRRNEEEVYRNVLALRDQLKSVRDIPQMTITFEEQTQFDLFFTVILLRFVKGKEPSVKELFEKSNPEIVYISDRIDIVGSVRKIYQKEATVFRLQLPKSQFFRKDRSVNLYKARRTVVAYMTKALGQVRDFNGGLILKQNERLEDFLSLMPNYFDEFLLENFFYSITPIAMQSILPAGLVKEWFLTFQEIADRELPKRRPYLVKVRRFEESLLVIIRSDDMTFKEEVLTLINRMQIPSLELAYAEVKLHGTYCFGLLYRPSQFGKEQVFTAQIQDCLKHWCHKVGEDQTLSLAVFGNDPTLDPRVAKYDHSYIIIKMLFEGLTRMGRDGRAEMAIAKSYEASADFRTYTFKLRQCSWSNGATITAHDFEYSWKKALGPHNQFAHGEGLFILKNARLAKFKKVSLDDVGVKALDDETLIVELEYSAPFFLEVVSHWSFSLINSVIDRLNPGWAYQTGEQFVCNGPFLLEGWSQNRKLTLVSNPHYWDHGSVRLKKIAITMVDPGQNALRMLQTGQVDLVGRPMTAFPPSGFEHSLDEGDLITYPLYGLVALALNTEIFPFNNMKVRQAFALALDVAYFENFVAHEYGGPCSSILPTQLSLHTTSLMQARQIEKARQLFSEGLGAIGFVKSDFPKITLSVSKGNYQQALYANLARQWREVLGIEIRIESKSWPHQLSSLNRRKFQMAAVEIKPYWRDPLHMLDRYSSKKGAQNFTGWENGRFRQLIQLAKQSDQFDERNRYLAEAEQLLVEEMPMIPLYQLSGNLLKRRGLKGVYTSECFNVDFKWARRDHS